MIMSPSREMNRRGGREVYAFIADETFERKAGEVFSLRELDGERGSAPCIQRFLGPNRLRDALFVNLQNPHSFRGRLLLGAGENQTLQEGDRRFLQDLAPYMISALQSFQHVSYLESKGKLYDELVSRIGVGELRLNADGEVVYSNTMAEALLQEGHLLVRNDRRLHATDRDDDKRLQQTIRQYILNAPPAPSEPLYLHSSEPHDVIGVLVRHLPVGPGPCGRDDAVVGIYLGDHTRRLSLSFDLLRKLFDFSRAEARVALHLAQGRNAEEIAELLHVSRNTVRTHISRIYAKTGIRRHAELVGMLVRTLASVWGS